LVEIDLLFSSIAGEIWLARIASSVPK